MPAGDTETEDAPTVAKPPTSVSASTGPSGTSLPSKSCTLFANSGAVSLCRAVDGTAEEGRPRRLAGPLGAPPPFPALPMLLAPPPALPPAPLPEVVGGPAGGGVPIAPVQAVTKR